MTTLKQLNSVQTLSDLEALKIGNVIYDLSFRGGYLGFHGWEVAEHFKLDMFYLPRKFGAYCNYLGGGVRGAVSPSDFGAVPKKKSDLLKALGEACVRVYINLENEDSMNDEVDSEGETNWDAIATNKARESGIRSAY